MTINRLLNDFLDYLEIEKGRSIKTRENYSRYLNDFLSISHVEKPEDINQEIILDYRLKLNRRKDKNNKSLDTNTQNYYVIAIRSFLRYLIKRDIKTLSPDKVELAKQAARKVSFLEKDELERLLNSPLTTTLKGLRDKTILELLFSTGLRVSELCKLNREDIDLNKDSFSIIGKGKQIRMVFLSPSAKECIKKYLFKRPDIDEALFVRMTKKPSEEANSLRLSSRSIQNVVRYYAAKSGLTKKVTPHTLRHSFGTDLLMNGADIRSVQELLGHKNISTTQIYTHVTNKRLEDAFKQYHSKK